MDARAGMLAQLYERSMGLGPEWEVSDAWFEERGGAPDARERTWHHLYV
jgi:transposase